MVSRLLAKVIAARVTNGFPAPVPYHQLIPSPDIVDGSDQEVNEPGEGNNGNDEERRKDVYLNRPRHYTHRVDVGIECQYRSQIGCEHGGKP